MLYKVCPNFFVKQAFKKIDVLQTNKFIFGKDKETKKIKKSKEL